MTICSLHFERGDSLLYQGFLEALFIKAVLYEKIEFLMTLGTGQFYYRVPGRSEILKYKKKFHTP